MVDVSKTFFRDFCTCLLDLIKDHWVNKEKTSLLGLKLIIKICLQLTIFDKIPMSIDNELIKVDYIVYIDRVPYFHY